MLDFIGKMRERSNRAVSKTVEPQGSGGSNPPLSVQEEDSFTTGIMNQVLFCRVIFWKDVRVVDGAVLERLCTERYRGFESPSFRIYPKMGIRNGSTPSEYEVSQHGCWCQCGRAGWSEPTGRRGAETESPSFRFTPSRGFIRLFR